MLAGEFGVTRDRSRRGEVEITLERKVQWATGDSELVQSHNAGSGAPRPRSQRPRARYPFGVQFREEPSTVAIGSEELCTPFGAARPRVQENVPPIVPNAPNVQPLPSLSWSC